MTLNNTTTFDPNNTISFEKNYNNNIPKLYIDSTSKITIEPIQNTLTITTCIHNKTLHKLHFTNKININPINKTTIENTYNNSPPNSLYIKKKSKLIFPNSKITIDTTMYLKNLKNNPPTLKNTTFSTTINLNKKLNTITLSNNYTKPNLYLSNNTNLSITKLSNTISTQTYIKFIKNQKPKLQNLTFQTTTTIKPFNKLTINKNFDTNNSIYMSTTTSTKTNPINISNTTTSLYLDNKNNSKYTFENKIKLNQKTIDTNKTIIVNTNKS